MDALVGIEGRVEMNTGSAQVAHSASSDDTDEALELLTGRALVLLTGAGLSTDSGIPDYRDTNGNWKRAPPVMYQDFVHDPVTRQRYWARSLVGWRTIGRAQPGPAHRAVAALAEAGRVGRLVTQNVDGLHQAAGSRDVIDLHGRLHMVCCLQCAVRLTRHEMQALLLARNPEWASAEARAAPDGDADLVADFSSFDVPACPTCGGLLKPDVVFFGESVPRGRVAAAFAALAAADAMLVAGSSLMVYSGFRFAQAAAAAGQPIAAVNLGRTRADALFMLKVQAPVGQALAAVATRFPHATSSAP